MKPIEYKNALAALGWTHAGIAERFGFSERTSLNYASGAHPVPLPTVALLRHLVRIRLTKSTAAAERFLQELVI